MLCNKQEAGASMKFWWFDNLEQKNTTASRCYGYSCKMGYFEKKFGKKTTSFICNERIYYSEHLVNLCVFRFWFLKIVFDLN